MNEAQVLTCWSQNQKARSICSLLRIGRYTLWDLNRSNRRVEANKRILLIKYAKYLKERKIQKKCIALGYAPF
jgi:hypothetical protein